LRGGHPHGGRHRFGSRQEGTDRRLPTTRIRRAVSILRHRHLILTNTSTAPQRGKHSCLPRRDMGLHAGKDGYAAGSKLDKDEGRVNGYDLHKSDDHYQPAAPERPARSDFVRWGEDSTRAFVAPPRQSRWRRVATRSPSDSHSSSHRDEPDEGTKRAKGAFQ